MQKFSSKSTLIFSKFVSTISSASKILSGGISGTKLLVLSGSPSDLSLLSRCRSSWTAREKNSFLNDSRSLIKRFYYHLLVSCPLINTSGNGNIGIGSAVACQWCIDGFLDNCKSSLFSLYAWRNLCTPRNWKTK